ncbi:hypothetical protein B0H16DRAFT_1789812 [Mycena metata]|uniref:Uncharacterized protein n=1 Tax=Mycena metata TaxID=1033252 RepID=A0AAD7MLY2_9AGAR|nr:hypothetical protein B0H16DRAFT_1789812 [Mycena metata]
MPNAPAVFNEKIRHGYLLRAIPVVFVLYFVFLSEEWSQTGVIIQAKHTITRGGFPDGTGVEPRCLPADTGSCACTAGESARFKWEQNVIQGDAGSQSRHSVIASFEYSLQFYAVGAIIKPMQSRLRREMKTWGADRNLIWSSRKIAVDVNPQILGENDPLAVEWILVSNVGSSGMIRWGCHLCPVAASHRRSEKPGDTASTVE